MFFVILSFSVALYNFEAFFIGIIYLHKEREREREVSLVWVCISIKQAGYPELNT